MTKKSAWICLSILFLFSLIPVQNINAQEEPPENISVILIVDNSGSMEANDPDNLRFTAAQLFTALLDIGDSLGVLTFSTTSQWITDGMITLESNQEKIDLIAQIQATEPDGYTDVQAAFRDVEKLFQKIAYKEKNPVVIFLTDGKPEIEQPYMTYEAETLALIEQIDVPVLSIALTSEAQTTFLKKLTGATDGMVIPAQTASDLLDAYLEVFGQVKDRTVIEPEAITASGKIILNVNPSLAPYIDKVSFIISKPETISAQLFDPGDDAITRNRSTVVFSTQDHPHFEVITIEDPAPGNWYFDVSGSANFQARAILHSRLRLVIESPVTLHQADTPFPLVVSLMEETNTGEMTRILGDADFSAQITRPDQTQESLDRFYDDGSHGDMQAGDGRYTRIYTNMDLPGSYAISVQGWKGSIPVARNTYVEAIKLPEMVLDRPLDPLYEIRSNEIPLQVHLEGGNPHSLDDGEILAKVSTPSGIVEEILLEKSDGVFSASFKPDENGTHSVVFVPKNASYQGLPFSQTVQSRFEVRLIPSLTILQNEFDLESIEIDKVKSGLVLDVPVQSTSSKDEVFEIRLNNSPYFSLHEKDIDIKIPTGKSSLEILLLPTSSLFPGEFTGQLLFSTKEDVDLINPMVEFNVNIYQPSVHITPLIVDVDEDFTCRNWAGLFSLDLFSDSSQVEILNLELETNEVDFREKVIQVKPGSSEIKFHIAPKDAIAPGDYETHLTIQGRQDLQIKPQSSILINFHVPPFWVRCRSTLIWMGIALLAGLVISVSGIRHLQALNTPPNVAGTLRYWHIDKPSDATCIDLTGMKKASITIGNKETCDILVKNLSEEESGATLKTMSVDGKSRVILHPGGNVRVKYRVLHVESPLTHGDIFSLEDHVFHYLSDEGE